MTPDDDAALLRELAELSARCQATLAHIGEIQLAIARRAADRAETQRIERAEFGTKTRTTLDE
jgi:hypothetical protein